MTTPPSRAARITVSIALICAAAISARALIAQDAPPQPPAHGQFSPGPDGRGGPGGPGGRNPMGPPPGQAGLAIERFSRELGLTDEQKAAIDALLTDERETAKAQFDTLRQAHQALDAAVLNVPTDDGLLQATVQQVATLEAQLTLTRVRTEARIFQLLNAEQQAKVRQLLADAEQRGPRHGRRG